MRNIHILPTDKQSNLFEIDGHFIIETGQLIHPKNYRCIYITSDEEIKEGDWALQFHYGEFSLVKCDAQNVRVINNKSENLYANKIILTTDQYLIADGIQPIDDEFLEWFVKNPSCEEVKIEKIKFRKNTLTHSLIEISEDDLITGAMFRDGIYNGYKIIIPKEEPKEETIEQHLELINNNIEEFDKAIQLSIQRKSKQETLEEVAETQLYITINKIIDGGKNLPKGYSVTRGQAVDYAFKIALEVAKWQQQQNKNLYSEEEVYTIQQISDLFIPIGKNGYIDDYLDYRLFSKEQPKLNFKEWFKQFKKK